VPNLPKSHHELGVLISNQVNPATSIGDIVSGNSTRSRSATDPLRLTSKDNETLSEMLSISATDAVSLQQGNELWFTAAREGFLEAVELFWIEESILTRQMPLETQHFSWLL
jgi:hypothetical protein